MSETKQKWTAKHDRYGIWNVVSENGPLSHGLLPIPDAKRIAHMWAAAPDLLAACEAAMEWLGDPDADSLEEWERIAEMFYRDTGFLRPGKDYPMEGPVPDESRQREAWNEWCTKRSCEVRRLILAALSKARKADE